MAIQRLSIRNKLGVSNIVTVNLETNTCTVQTVCPDCKGMTPIHINSFGSLHAWQKGAPIQEALSELSDNEREALMTGICPKCWSGMFGEDEDEDE